MFVPLFAVSVIVAFGLAFGVSVIFKRMTATVLSRNLAENVSQATTQILQIAILLVGVSNGARIHLLKDYLTHLLQYETGECADEAGIVEPGDV